MVLIEFYTAYFQKSFSHSSEANSANNDYHTIASSYGKLEVTHQLSELQPGLCGQDDARSQVDKSDVIDVK